MRFVADDQPRPIGGCRFERRGPPVYLAVLGGRLAALRIVLLILGILYAWAPLLGAFGAEAVGRA